jgi:hypothetical protein
VGRARELHEAHGVPGFLEDPLPAARCESGA